MQGEVFLSLDFLADLLEFESGDLVEFELAIVEEIGIAFNTFIRLELLIDDILLLLDHLQDLVLCLEVLVKLSERFELMTFVLAEEPTMRTYHF